MCTHDAVHLRHDAVHLRHGQLKDRGELLHVVVIPRAVLLPLRQPQPQSRRGHPHHGHWQRLRWIVCELSYGISELSMLSVLSMLGLLSLLVLIVLIVLDQLVARGRRR